MPIHIDPYWKTSALGNNITLASSGDLKSLESQRPILFIGGVHGDEPEGVRLAEDLLSWLKGAPSDKIALPWLLIPCLNPDGFKKNERVNGNGVDLNRNYPSRSWTSEASAPRYFPGTKAGSEPEVRAVMELTQIFNPRLIIHFHSWQPCVVYAGDGALQDATKLASMSGYPLKSDIGYPTPGSLSQYGWFDHGIPVICIEAQEHSPLDTIWGFFGEALCSILADPSSRK